MGNMAVYVGAAGLCRRATAATVISVNWYRCGPAAILALYSVLKRFERLDELLHGTGKQSIFQTTNVSRCACRQGQLSALGDPPCPSPKPINELLIWVRAGGADRARSARRMWLARTRGVSVDEPYRISPFWISRDGAPDNTIKASHLPEE